MWRHLTKSRVFVTIQNSDLAQAFLIGSSVWVALMLFLVAVGVL